MRPDFVFSDASVSPSFFFSTPAKKPRTECGCQPVTFEMTAMVVPPLVWSRPRTRSCLVVLPLERDAVCVFFFVFDLSCFVGLVRGSGLVLNLATKDLRGWATPSSHHVDPAQVSHPRGLVLRRRNGASGITSNAPFTAEVQSNIEQCCCSIIAKAGKNPVLGSEVQESRLFRTETEFVKLPVPLDIGSRRRSILMPRGRRPSTGLGAKVPLCLFLRR